MYQEGHLFMFYIANGNSCCDVDEPSRLNLSASNFFSACSLIMNCKRCELCYRRVRQRVVRRRSTRNCRLPTISEIDAHHSCNDNDDVTQLTSSRSTSDSLTRGRFADASVPVCHCTEAVQCAWMLITNCYGQKQDHTITGNKYCNVNPLVKGT